MTRSENLAARVAQAQTAPKAAEVPAPVTSIAPDADEDETDVTPGASAPA